MEITNGMVEQCQFCGLNNFKGPDPKCHSLTKLNYLLVQMNIYDLATNCSIPNNYSLVFSFPCSFKFQSTFCSHAFWVGLNFIYCHT